jgi:Calcium binding
MAPEEECESEMLVRVRWHGRSVAVPLSQLKPLGAEQTTTVKPLVIGTTGWRGAINSESLIS